MAADEGRCAGKIALVTGAARGQGRSHAVRLAAEGADVVAVDLCADLATVPYPGARPADLDETAELVRAQGRRVLSRVADVRDHAAVAAVVADAVAEFGHLDIVCANAGIASYGKAWEISPAQWQEMLDVNLTGVWNTAATAIPPMLEQGTGGSLILTSSVAGVTAYANVAHYVAAKHGVVGVMRALAVELAPHSIRVNAVLPASVETPMVDNPAFLRLFAPHRDEPTLADAAPAMTSMNALPVHLVEPVDISHAVVFLASDESRYVTGVALPVDAGSMFPFKIR